MATHLFDLLSRDTQLRRVASTHGGEYAGPCPFCGGQDRFRVWPDAERPGYWCRVCERKGDAIQYLRDKDGLSYRQACAYLGTDPGARPPVGEQEIHMPALELDPPGPAWRERAIKFCTYAFKTLWSEQGAEARAYLIKRGLSEQTIQGAGLGYNPQDWHDKAEAWGMPAEVWLPAGIVIPCVVSGHFWRVNIRRWATERRYVAVYGSLSTLFGADGLSADRPAMLLESELDALLVQQEAGDLVAPVATGGTGGARHLHWLAHLARPRMVLVSHDTDEKGAESAAWWLSHLPYVKHWPPLVDKDPTDMYALGLSVREWAELGAEAAIAQRAPARITPAAPIAPPALIAPALRIIEGNPAAVRKLAMGPDTLARLAAVKPLAWQSLLNHLPATYRRQEPIIRAAKAYIEAGQPIVPILLWNGTRIPDKWSGAKLWSALGDALRTGGQPEARALAILEQLAQNAGPSPEQARAQA